jgi:hypothetical protein
VDFRKSIDGLVAVENAVVGELRDDSAADVLVAAKWPLSTQGGILGQMPGAVENRLLDTIRCVGVDGAIHEPAVEKSARKSIVNV